MAQQGGKRPVRTKSQAKPVSGPGALSQRTDMVASDPNVYGDRKATQELMSAAPMAKAQSVPSAPPITSLFAPTERPNEPVTLSRLAQNDPTGEVEMILQDLSSRGIV